MTNVGKGISVMPETIYFIGGEVIENLVGNEMIDADDAANVGFKFMCHLKNHLLTITAEISSIYAQAINQMSITVAHDLAFEYLYDLAIDLLGLKPKKSQWEMLKEDATLSPHMKAIITAIENATPDELVALYVIYPAVVDAYQSHIGK